MMVCTISDSGNIWNRPHLLERVERLMMDGQFPVGVQAGKGLNIGIQTLISLSSGRGDESSWYNYAGQTCAVMCLVRGS